MASAFSRIDIGVVRLWGDWDFAGAERAFTDGLRLNPSYATGRQWFAGYLVATGRSERAVREARRALRLDPFSRMITAGQSMERPSRAAV